MSKEIDNDQIEEAIEETVKRFFGFDRFLSNTNLSRGSVIRAIRFAMHNGVTDKNVKLKSDQEARLALYIGGMLDSRLIMQAKLLKDNETSNQTEEKANESEQNS